MPLLDDTTIPRYKLIIFSVVTVGIFFICLELAARLVLSYKKDSFEYIFYGFKHMEQKKRLQKIEGKNGEAAFYIGIPSADKKNPVNSLGFRGPEIHKKKPGIIRIVCLGGSTTYGEGLRYSDTYPAILQKKLDEKWGIGHYEVVNGGQPGSTLPQIFSLTKQYIIPLQPDIIILMNINNNLHAPGFWFVGINDPNKKSSEQSNKQETSITSPIKRLKRFLVGRLYSVKGIIVRHLAFACLIDEAILSKVDRYFLTFDWKAFSRALMAQDNIWQAAFREDLHREISLLSQSNPEIKVILLGEAVNTMKYPALEAPFSRAKEIMREASKAYSNVYAIDFQPSIIGAAKNGKRVWQTPSSDPLHLVRAGNEIIAEVLVDHLSTIPGN